MQIDVDKLLKGRYKKSNLRSTIKDYLLQNEGLGVKDFKFFVDTALANYGEHLTKEEIRTVGNNINLLLYKNMEVLRSVLKILYSRQDPKLILDRVKNARFTFVDEIIDEFSFQKLLCVEMAGSYTLDNARTAMQHLKEKWLNAVEGDNLMYVHRKSVFNVLLHFTSEVLTERDLTPVCHYEHLLRWHDLSSYLSEDLLTTSF